MIVKTVWVQARSLGTPPQWAGRSPWVWRVSMGIAGLALAVPLVMLALMAMVVIVLAAAIFMLVFSLLSLVDRLLGMLQGPSDDGGRRNVRVLREDSSDPSV